MLVFFSVVITAVYYVEVEIKLWNSETLELLRYRWLYLVQHYYCSEDVHKSFFDVSFRVKN